MRASATLTLVIAVILALALPSFSERVVASSVGPDTVVLSPSPIIQAVPAAFSQDVVISYSHNAAGAFPKVVTMQYVVQFDTAVIDIDNSVCAASTDSNTYCGVTAGTYAQAFAIQELPTNNPCGTNFCANEQPVAGTIKQIFVASIATIPFTGGPASAGGIHSTIHWKVTASGSGTASINFSPADTFYGTSSTSAIDPRTIPIFYTPTNGFYSLNTAVPPQAVFKFLSGDRYGGVPDQNVTLDGSLSFDPDAAAGSLNKGILNWTWSFGDNSPNRTTTVPRISHNYTIAGSYTARLQVGDADQHLKSSWAQAIVQISAVNLPPVAKFTWTIKNPSRYSPSKVFTNSTLFFDGSASGDPDGDLLRYYWDFGDGTVYLGLNDNNNVTHQYNLHGTHTVTLTVDEYLRNPGERLSDATSQTITVLGVAVMAIVTCSASSTPVNQPTQCTTTITDISAVPTSPEGTVTFSQNSSGSFTPSNMCTLTPTSEGAPTSSCSVSYTPSPGSEGTQTIMVSYSGDPTHQSSTGSTSLTVTKRATSTSVSCSSSKLTGRHSTLCTVTVTDTLSGTPITPSGTVAWESSGKGTFSPRTCTLIGAVPTVSCTVTYTASPGRPLSQTITATYSGDGDHSGSSGTTLITTP